MTRILTTFFVALICPYIYSQEIVQWRGKNRDGIYFETGLLKKWPKNGPEMIWHYDKLGNGHTSAAVTKTTVYTTGEINEMGYLFAFDHNGKLLWKSEYGREWTESWPGVRTTPLIYDKKLYIMSGFGKVVCMNTENGKILWSVDLMKDYDGRNISWGVTENLLIDENKLFCTPGGIEANVIAINRNTGELIWKSKANREKSAYCSPALIKLPQRKIIVTMTANSIIGIDASTGEYLWRHEQTNEHSVHANTPLYHDGYLFCLSGYGRGAVMLKLSENGNKITEIWRNRSLDSRMGGVVLLNGRIYGAGDASRKWVCLDWKTGKELFSSTEMTIGNLIYADGKFYCYSQRGKVGLVEPAANDFNVISTFQVPYGAAQHWAHLVIHNKRLYVRHGNSLMVYSISAD